MVSVATLTPIAAQLARSINLNDLFPGDAFLEAVRAVEQGAEPGEPKLPADIQHFYEHYCVVVRAAAQLLHAPAFDGLARFQEDIEDEYTPGGPPQSPVYDSFSTQLVLGSVRQGIGSETPYSVLARLLLRDPSRAPLQSMAQSLAHSRFDLYRVKAAGRNDAELEPVRGGGAFSVRLIDPFLRQGDFGLMRVLRFDDKLFIADSPYLLQASEDKWRQHLERVVALKQDPTPAPAPRNTGKLSSKEQARRRQKDKAKASRHEPEEVIKRYLQFGLSDRYWLDYIMDAYAGERNGIVFLAGVPDRPELLPNSTEYKDDAEVAMPPVGRFRTWLARIAKEEGVLDLVLAELRRVGDFKGAPEGEPSPNVFPLLAAYASFGFRAKDGTTVLSRYERSHTVESMHPDVRSFVVALKRGWFSVFRIDRVHLDQALEVFDLLREQNLRISERVATRQVGVGDFILSWLCKGPTGTLTFEDALARIPAVEAEPLLPFVAALRRGMPPLADEEAWKRAAAGLPLPLIAAIIEVRANPALPELVNTSGDPPELVAGKDGSRPQPQELPPEVVAQLNEVVLAKVRSTLDEAIPQFKGKTLRQLARSTKGRPDAIGWLREQERLLRSNPQLAGLDMRPLWEELALPYQGLETDPPL
jgi:hypothetical protein